MKILPFQGTAQCHARIFLWSHEDKIVISDIDGTITKSDVLGQILPAMGRDWFQTGVTGLFSKIRNNGYNFIYLSARAISQVCLVRLIDVSYWLLNNYINYRISEAWRGFLLFLRYAFRIFKTPVIKYFQFYWKIDNISDIRRDKLALNY